MAWFHPAAVEHRRKLFTRPDGQNFLRHDAHRVGPPKPQEKSWAARMVDQMRAEEAEAARAAEIAAFEAQHRALRRELAEIKCELAWRALCRKYGFNPDQPRDEQGRWTDAGGASQDTSTDSAGESVSDRQVSSDEASDPIRPGAQYAQARIEIDTSALTGIQDIDRTTVALADRLGKVVDSLPEGSGRLYGIVVHTEFKASLLLDPIPNVTAEPTFGGSGIYGSKDSIRPDAVLRSPTGDIRAFYDVKTGDAGIEPPRAEKFRGFSTTDVPVIELSLRRGVLLKSMQ